MTYIYGDIIIIENFIMNYIIIFLTARFSKLPTNFIKMLAGAIVGATYSVIVFLPSMKFLNTLSMKISLSVLIIVIVFTPERIMDFIRIFMIFYLISFVFGGTSFALIYMTNHGGLSSKGLFYISEFPVSLLIVTGIIGFLIIKFSWGYIQQKISKENIMTTISIYIDGEEIEVKGIFDTANFLYDPISNLPVIIVEYDFIKEILPEEIKSIFKENNEKDFEKVSEILMNSDWIKRFRMIPYSSLGKENGLLVGFKTDKIKILDNNKEKEVSNAIMAIYSHKLSKSGEYNALLNPEILNI